MSYQLVNIYIVVILRLKNKLSKDVHRYIESYLNKSFFYFMSIYKHKSLPIETRFEDWEYDWEKQTKLNRNLIRAFFTKMRFFSYPIINIKHIIIMYHSGYYTSDYLIQAQYSICTYCGNYEKKTTFLKDIYCCQCSWT
jgi:hypothetical protein